MDILGDVSFLIAVALQMDKSVAIVQSQCASTDQK